MKTKNAPKGLKCNKPYFFFETGVPKRGGGEGGSDIWEKFPKNPVSFFLFFWGGVGVPKRLHTFLTVVQKNPQHTYMCKQGGAGGYMAI